MTGFFQNGLTVLSLGLDLDTIDRLMDFIRINLLVMSYRVKLFQKQIYPGSFTTDQSVAGVCCFAHSLIDGVEKIERSEDGNDFLKQTHSFTTLCINRLIQTVMVININNAL